ncbi:MAG TPA: hypothetical protein VKB05_12935 [Pyrinomonadaceae bacterium]|nr:hypothetical protein [Pyrinomonadaceae bacterium]
MVESNEQALERLKARVSHVNLSDERSKPRLLALLFCDYINQTKEEKTNLVGVFDRIYVHPDKKKTPRFALFIRFAEALDGPVTLTVFGPSGQPVFGAEFDANAAQFEAVRERQPEYPRQVQAIVGLQFEAKTEGLYWFDVSYMSQSLGGAGLPVEFIKEGEKTGGTDTFV